ncbi:MAG: YfhO family protein, partial [Clostridia bacterium]|nr:YfhO family protein [Clostridia bacterium]
MTDNTLNKKSLLQRIFKDNLYCWVSMLCAGLIMLLVYFCFELFPFGEVTILRMDLYHQYGPLFAEFYDRVTGLKSFIYSWTSGMGGPFLGNYFNYLSSPWAIIMLIFGHKNMPEAIAAMIFVKAVCSAGSFTLFLKKSQGRHDFTTAAFGLLYSMCGYFVAYYWNVMWIDAMVYFPMVMYGIEKIVNKRRPGVYIVSLALTLISNYYMGYMTCIFSVLFFITYYIMKCDITALADNTVYYYDAQGNKKYSFIEKVKGSLLVRSGVTFALGSLAAGALVAVALIPTVVILKSCSATSGSWPSGY